MRGQVARDARCEINPVDRVVAARCGIPEHVWVELPALVQLDHRESVTTDQARLIGHRAGVDT